MASHRAALALGIMIVAFAALAAAQPAPGLAGKLIVGYQGWFGCPGDFEGNREWIHWFDRRARVDSLTVDQLPLLAGLDEADLCDTGLARPDGTPVRVYSAQNPRVVATHFRWMREHGIDGAAAQRFVSELADDSRRRRGDNVLGNVRSAAEAQGRVFFVTYDVSGADARVTDRIRADWKHLAGTLKVTASASYLRDRGKPVLMLWGFGFRDRPGKPGEVLALLADLRRGRDGLQAATVIGGVPAQWRTLQGDSRAETAWGRVYRSFDVISPWSVGRFGDEEGANAFVRDRVRPDLAETRRLGIGYMPVIFPGFSWYNLMTQRGRKEQAVLDRVPRRCGNFLWRQASGMLDAGVETIYAAMFDEVDEATALFPTETRADRLPVGARMLSLDRDGCALPEDWYLRVTGKAAQFLREGRKPPKSLDAVLPRP